MDFPLPELSSTERAACRNHLNKLFQRSFFKELRSKGWKWISRADPATGDLGYAYVPPGGMGVGQKEARLNVDYYTSKEIVMEKFLNISVKAVVEEFLGIAPNSPPIPDNDNNSNNTPSTSTLSLPVGQRKTVRSRAPPSQDEEKEDETSLTSSSQSSSSSSASEEDDDDDDDSTDSDASTVFEDKPMRGTRRRTTGARSRSASSAAETSGPRKRKRLSKTKKSVPVSITFEEPWSGTSQVSAVRLFERCVVEFEDKARNPPRTFRVGDFVRVWMRAGDDTPKGIAQVCSFFRDRYGKNNWCEVRWFERATDVTGAGGGAARRRRRALLEGGKDGVPHEKRLYETDAVTEIEAESLAEVIQVNFAASPVSASPPDFTCTHFYSPVTGMLRACGPTRPASHYSLRRTAIASGTTTTTSSSSSSSTTALSTTSSRAPPNNPFSKALESLQISAVPTTLPCRDREKERIRSFIESSILRGGVAHSLYISGLPGTGKTATVNEVLRILREKATRGELPPFKVVEINGMKLPRVEDAYEVLAQAYCGVSGAGWKRAHRLVDEYLRAPDPNREVSVLVVDELDNLVTANQTFLYNLFEWPANRNSRLVCVAIANIMDLPEKLLPKINSRLGMGRVSFTAYQREQIETIVRARLEGLEVFDPDALDLCARKVAAVSGDVRRALQMMRRAVEICVRIGADMVTIDHVNQAAREINSKTLAKGGSVCSKLEKVALVALHKHCKLKGIEEDFVDFRDVFFQVENQARGLSDPFSALPSRREVLGACLQLERAGLVSIKRFEAGGAPLREPMVRLLLETDDLHSALQDDADLLQRL